MLILSRSVLAIVCGFCLLAGGEAAGAEWKTTTVDRTWSIDMPGTPQVQRRTIDTRQGKLELTMYLLELAGNTQAYGANASQLPSSLPDPRGAEIEKRLDNMQAGAVANMKAKVVESRRISFDGHPGREFVAQLADGKFIRQRGYLVQRTLYSLVAANVPVPEAERFFASFKLLGEK